ncbi:MAG: transcriptional repressor [Pseudarcicella sp.]|nr:transcriptional repressor [Pseudarcicella sp.]MBP6410889.1 transcriptional repressor [Pseudarcicella sp.]
MEAKNNVTLKAYKLRQTDCRQDVLDFFSEYAHALSHSDIENHLKTKYDRVTLYRTLKTFLDAGLIHKVLDDEGGSKYALCKEACHEHAHDHHHDHVHFKCQQCGYTSCLEDIVIPEIKLPIGFKKIESNLLIQGICKSCLVL